MTTEVEAGTAALAIDVDDQAGGEAEAPPAAAA